MPKNFNTGILDSLRVGIAKIETGGSANPYSTPAGDKNKDGQPDSSALGKYQFLKSYWWDKKGSIMSIKEFAKSKNGAFGAVEKWEDFGNSPELQEEYFSYYAENFLIPQAKKALAKGNPSGLTLDQACAVIHKDGSGAGAKAIYTGKLPGETGTNVSSKKYLEVFNGAVEKAGLKNYTLNEYVNNKIKEAESKGEKADLSPEEKNVRKSAEERQAIYAKRQKAIDGMDAEQKTKESLRKNLWQEIVNNDDADLYNDNVDKLNDSNKEKNQELNDMVSMAKKLEVFYNEATDKEKRKFEQTGYFDTDNKDDKELYERVKKSNPELFTSGKEYNFKHRVNQKALFDKIKTGYKDLSGVDIEITPGYEGKGKVGAINSDFFGNLFASWGDDKTRTGTFEFKEGAFPSLDVNKSQKIDTSVITKQKPKVDQTVPEEEKTEEVKKEEAAAEEKAAVEEKKDTQALGAADQFFNDNLKAFGAGGDDKSYGATKQELPFDAVMGAALGFIGNDKAKNAKTPLRTEEVGEAMKNLTAELAKVAKLGLPIEVEAAIKNDLNEAYQGGLASINNASGGNRALVLGNQGQLENAKNKGLVNLGIADYEAKDRAMEKYMRAQQYIDGVNLNREIANHGIKYGEAKEKQAEGKQLATAGFSQLVEAIQYQKENGPGSANDMYRSYLTQKMFGYDPKMKDDGTGQIGTKSAYEKTKLAHKEGQGLAISMNEKMNSLNPDQKAAVNKVAETYNDKNTIYGIVDYLKDNPNADVANLELDNMDLAKKTGDYGLLSLSREAAMGGGKREPVETVSTLPPIQEPVLPGLPTLPAPGLAEMQKSPLEKLQPEELDAQLKQSVALTDQYYNEQ